MKRIYAHPDGVRLLLALSVRGTDPKTRCEIRGESTHANIYYANIYYEYVRKSDDQTLLQPIPESPPETCEQPPDNSVVNHDTNNESDTETSESVTEHTTKIHNEHNHTTPRNNATRYNLRTEPQPKTYQDFLVHELRVKPALLKFMQGRPVN